MQLIDALTHCAVRLGLTLSETKLPGSKSFRRANAKTPEMQTLPRHLMLIKMNINLITAMRAGYVRLPTRGQAV
jgi:hypothetical protein